MLAQDRPEKNVSLEQDSHTQKLLFDKHLKQAFSNENLLYPEGFLNQVEYDRKSHLLERFSAKQLKRQLDIYQTHPIRELFLMVMTVNQVITAKEEIKLMLEESVLESFESRMCFGQLLQFKIKEQFFLKNNFNCILVNKNFLFLTSLFELFFRSSTFKSKKEFKLCFTLIRMGERIINSSNECVLEHLSAIQSFQNYNFWHQFSKLLEAKILSLDKSSNSQPLVND